MHEEEARLLGKHVAMKPVDFNMMLFECWNDRFDFIGDQNEVSRCCHFSRARFLKLIDSATPAKGHCHPARRHCDGFGPWNSDGKNSSLEIALMSEDVLNIPHKCGVPLWLGSSTSLTHWSLDPAKRP